MGTNAAEHRRLKFILFELHVLPRLNIRKHRNIVTLMAYGYAPSLVTERSLLDIPGNC
ncbi:hypothetical protein GGI42DRAFT_327143 [Trichoderma sp. SZMC 28013]